jgi:hypothetical protein
VLATAIIGTGATVAMHRAPGPLLGGAIIAGTLAAVLGVRRGAVYQLIPVPALAYMVGALAAGLLRQQNAGPSRSGLAVSATQWIAGGFVTMAIATVLAVAVTVIRWLMSRRAGGPGPSRDREPEPLASDRPTSRTVFPSAPDTGSWRARPTPPRPDPGAEPPSWPWPEEPVPRSKRAARRDPAPPTEPFFRANKSSSRALPPAQPRSPSPGRSPRPEPPSRPGPPSFGTPRDLARAEPSGQR